MIESQPMLAFIVIQTKHSLYNWLDDSWM